MSSRSPEILNGLVTDEQTLRRVRDLDVLTHKLFIGGDKIDAGERSVKIPDEPAPAPGT